MKLGPSDAIRAVNLRARSRWASSDRNRGGPAKIQAAIPQEGEEKRCKTIPYDQDSEDHGKRGWRLETLTRRFAPPAPGGRGIVLNPFLSPGERVARSAG